MEWFIFSAVVVWIVCRFSAKRSRRQKQPKRSVCDQSAGKKVDDDFAGGSVGAFFLLGEIIDPPGDENRQEPANQDMQQNEHQEESFEDDFL